MKITLKWFYKIITLFSLHFQNKISKWTILDIPSKENLPTTSSYMVFIYIYIYIYMCVCVCVCDLDLWFNAQHIIAN